MTMYSRVSGSWKTIKSVYARVSGTWYTVGQISVKVSGSWKNVWSYSWSVGSWGSCSKTCGGGTQTRTITCARNDGQTVDDSLCVKYVGSKGSTSQSCNTQSCEECPSYKKEYNAWLYRVNDRSGNDNGGVTYSATIYYGGNKVTSPDSSSKSTTYGGYLYTRGTVQETEKYTSGAAYVTDTWYDYCRTPV